MSTVDLTRDERAVRQTSGPVLGMVLFVASEAMFFATFFGAYFTIYSVNPVWPPAGFRTSSPAGTSSPLCGHLSGTRSSASAQPPRRSRARRLARDEQPARGRLPRLQLSIPLAALA